MLQRKPVNRLGYNGIKEIKEHPWLKYYPWKDLYDKKLEAPFAPKSLDNFDKKYCEGPDKIGNDTLERYQNYYKNEALADVFMNYSFDNILTVHPNKKESGIQRMNGTTSSSGGNNSQYSNNMNINSTQKKRISSSLSNLNNINNKNTNISSNNSKNSVNNMLKNKIKITESLYLNNGGNSSGVSNLSKNTPFKNNRTKSLQMNSNSNNNFLNTPNHLRNISNSNIASNLLSPSYKNPTKMENLQSNTPSKDSMNLNNLNMLKTRTKNFSMNSTNSINNNLNIANNNNSNNPSISKTSKNNSTNSSNQIKLNMSNSNVAMMSLKQGGTPFKRNEKLPFIEHKLIPARQSSSNVSIPKKFNNSPGIKSGLNVNNYNGNVPKSGTKYSTLSANSTSGSTISMNFLHKRSGSTNTFNNY
jgi:hypothetical protein